MTLGGGGGGGGGGGNWNADWWVLEQQREGLAKTNLVLCIHSNYVLLRSRSRLIS